MIRYRIEIPLALRDLMRYLPPELKAKVKGTLRSIADNPYRAKDLRDELKVWEAIDLAGFESSIVL